MLNMSGGAPVGYDLDGVATCPGPDSCRTAPGVSPHCDGAHGRDNAGGELLATLGAFGVFDANEVTRGLQAGAFGVVFALRDYNGGANDARVTLALYISNGVDAPTDAGPRLPPKFDGTDRWTVDPGSLLGGVTSVGTDCGASARACAPLYFDDNAYVTGNVLVAKLDFPLSLGGGAITLDLTGSIVTARLVKQGDTVRFEDGQIAGRWSTAKLLSSLSVLADPLNGNVPLCGENPTYQGLKKKICAAADISVDARRDGTDGPCDALSIAFGFRAEAAHLGTITQSAAPRGGCGDGGAPYKDSCP